MNKETFLFYPLAAMISFFTAMGIFLHDTNIDKAFVHATSPIIHEGKHASPESTPHTHAERTSLKEISRTNPRVHPRDNEKRHYGMRRAVKGAHPFDGYLLPM